MGLIYFSHLIVHDINVIRVSHPHILFLRVLEALTFRLKNRKKIALWSNFYAAIPNPLGQIREVKQAI